MKQRWRINKSSNEKQRIKIENDREDINPYPMTRQRERERETDAIMDARENRGFTERESGRKKCGRKQD